MEDQIAQYKQFDEDYQKRLSAEKATLEAAHQAELEKVKATTAAESGTTSKKEARDSLLVLSRFLRAAAAKRQGGDETSAENRAFEGALLLVYGGETPAVDAMESLISGSEEKVPTVDQVPSEFTCKSSSRQLSIFLYLKDCPAEFFPNQTNKSVISRSTIPHMLRRKLGWMKSPSLSWSLRRGMTRYHLGQIPPSLIPA